MTTVELLSNLRGLDVKLWVEGERLRYSAPPGALTPDLLRRLTEHKSEVINFLRGVGTAAAADGPIRPADRARPLPLSYAQRRLWILDRLNAGGPAYHIPVLLRLEGPLDVEAIRRSIDEIVKRHEVLRTVFDADEGHPSQTVLPTVELSVP